MKIVGLNRKIRYEPRSKSKSKNKSKIDIHSNSNTSANERVEKEAKNSNYNKKGNERIEKQCKEEAKTKEQPSLIEEDKHTALLALQHRTSVIRQARIKSLLLGGHGGSLFSSATATGTGTGTGTTGIVYDVQRRDSRTSGRNCRSNSSSKVVSSRKKSVVNESYDQWNNNKPGTRSSIVNKSYKETDTDTNNTNNTNKNTSTKQEEKKKKKKKVSTTNGNASSTRDDGSSSMKEKEKKKKKKQEKKGKLQAAATPYATTTTRTTGTSTGTQSLPTTTRSNDNDDSFAVGDRVMKVNSIIPYKRYVIVNYLTAITDKSHDKVIIRPVASYTPVYETLAVTKVVRYPENKEE